MVFRTLAVLIACTVMLCPSAFAKDEWIEDDDLHDFYPQGVQRNQQYEVPSHSPYDGDTQGGDDGGVINIGGGMGTRMNSSMGGGNVNDGFLNEDGYFSSNQGDVPIAPPGGQMGNRYPGRPMQQVPPKKKGVLGKIGSMVKAPFDTAGDFFGSPELWYGAGQLAGAGANMYMNRNNPYYNNPYYNPYGGMNPYSPYSPYGYGLGGFGGPLSSFGYEPLGMLGPSGYGLPYGGNTYYYPGQTPGRPFYPVGGGPMYGAPGLGGIYNPGLGGIYNPGLGGIYNPGLGGIYNPGLGGIYNPGMGGIYNPGLGGLRPGFGGLSPFGLGGSLAPTTVPSVGK